MFSSRNYSESNRLNRFRLDNRIFSGQTTVDPNSMNKNHLLAYNHFRWTKIRGNYEIHAMVASLIVNAEIIDLIRFIITGYFTLALI